MRTSSCGEKNMFESGKERTMRKTQSRGGSFLKGGGKYPQLERPSASGKAANLDFYAKKDRPAAKS